MLADGNALSHVGRIERTQLERAFPKGDYAKAWRDGVSGNSAVLASIQGHLGAFPQPVMRVASADGQFIDKAPAMSPAARLQALLDRPNPYMSGSEFLRVIALYQLVGGNCYIWKQRALDGSVLRLWPFHAGQMRPVPGATVDQYVSHYTYSVDHTTRIPIEPSEIIHLKWPFLPNENALEGQSPVIGLYREILTDNEATRLAWALLRNDAVGSSLWRVPDMPDPEFEKVKGGIMQRFSGTAKGSPIVIKGKKDDVDVTRLSFDMKQMAADTLHAIPESRIAAGLRYPAIMSQLLTGLKEGREGNYESTRRLYHEDTLVPWWNQVSDDLDCGLTEATADRGAEFDGDLTVVFDTSAIIALRANESEVLDRAAKRSLALKELQLLYYSGTMPREAVVANAAMSFSVDDDEADRLFAPIKEPPPTE